jgi:polysaccharide deacetylase 2 family uncharacterized protein YibQ
MKFIQKFLPKFSIAKLLPAKLRSNLWLFLVVIFIFVFVINLVFQIFLGQDARIERALLSAQRLEVSLETGKIEGKIISSKKEDAAPVIADKKSDAVAPVAVPVDGAEVVAPVTASVEGVEAVAPVDGTAPPAEGSVPAAVDGVTPVVVVDGVTPVSQAGDELAWVVKDFIGPPLPQDVIDGFLQGEGGASVLEVKKVSVKDLGDKPVIVVIVKGLGLSSSTTEDAMDLPKDVTLGFSPYSTSLDKWVEKAKTKGHEFVLNLPMETSDYLLNDPGPYALVTKMEKEENITRLKMLLSLIKGYQAVYSEKEEIFTHAVNSVKPILDSLKQQGKYFIYGGGYSDFSLIQIAEEMQYPIVVSDFLLDDEISADGINKKLEEVEATAKSRGYAVVMTHPYPITVRMLQRWLSEADKRGFKLVPISELLGKDFTDK